MDLIKSIQRANTALTKYFLYSLIVTVFDTGIVWLLVRFSVLHLVAANTIGVIAGFGLHYILASKSVFDAEYGIVGFVLYLITFLFGLILANWLIYASYSYVFTTYSENFRILMSKGVSIAVPFFAMYYMRKYLFLMLNKRSG